MAEGRMLAGQSAVLWALTVPEHLPISCGAGTMGYPPRGAGGEIEAQTGPDA